MLCREIVNIIERTYPKGAALEWDNVGLLIGRAEKEVRKIYVALDATEDVIREAVLFGADMLVTHHPLIFSPMKKITDEDFIGRNVVALLQQDIACYAMHTNYDVLGMAELSGNRLELANMEVLELTDMQRGEGIGRVGELRKEMTLEECCVLVKQRFHLPAVKVFGEKERLVRRAAISPGSGKGMTEAALKRKAQVLITGDIGHHEGIDALAQGLAIIDAGHYGLEHIFIEDMVKYLEKHTTGIEVKGADIVYPFEIM